LFEFREFIQQKNNGYEKMIQAALKIIMEAGNGN